MRSWRLAGGSGGSGPAPLLVLLASSEVPIDDDWLGPRELAVLGRLRLERRRLDWRLGRFAAKRALRTWLEQDPAARAAAIETLAAEDGAPEPWLDGSPLALALALSHRAGFALAAVADGGSALGCDLERVEPRSDAFVRDYFTAREIDALEREPASERPLLANLVWSAKESALKARRAGLRLDTREVEVDLAGALRAGREAGRWLPLAATLAGGPTLTGAWRIEGDLVLTWLVGTPPSA